MQSRAASGQPCLVQSPFSILLFLFTGQNCRSRPPALIWRGAGHMALPATTHSKALRLLAPSFSLPGHKNTCDPKGWFGATADLLRCCGPWVPLPAKTCRTPQNFPSPLFGFGEWQCVRRPLLNTDARSLFECPVLPHREVEPRQSLEPRDLLAAQRERREAQHTSFKTDMTDIQLDKPYHDKSRLLYGYS
jgi:hypothetical protein